MVPTLLTDKSRSCSVSAKFLKPPLRIESRAPNVLSGFRCFAISEANRTRFGLSAYLLIPICIPQSFLFHSYSVKMLLCFSGAIIEQMCLYGNSHIAQNFPLNFLQSSENGNQLLSIRIFGLLIAIQPTKKGWPLI